MADDQKSFVAALLDPRMGLRGKLKALSEVIDWAPLARMAEALQTATTGRKPYPALPMLKALYLASLYDLSDPALEEALIDRVSFRLFCGFSLEEVTPDETTLCRFRHACATSGLLEAAFAEVNRQFEAKGLVVKKGTLMDATIVAAASRRPPLAASAKPELPQEPGASFTRKAGQSHFGYRVHVGADEGSGLVRRVALTPAHINESLVADGLVSGDERAVYADKAYENKHRRTALKARGIKDRIMHRSHKNQAALPRWQQRRNALIARRRAQVERVFASLKRRYGRARMRYRDFRRNLADIYRVMTVFNLRRAISLASL